MLTLNQIVSQITNLAAAHNQIAESGVGDFAEWQAKERSYPILWVFHESTSVNQMEITFSIRLICADRVIVGEEGDNTEGHEQEVLSDTLLVLLDFLAYFQQNHSQPYNVVTSATIDPFTERLNDRLAGNSVTIQIRQPFDWNKCQIPQSGASIPPSVDGLTLYNFCDPAVIARLTSAQVACLQSEYALPADITINSAPFGTAPSGGTFNVPVVNGGSNPVGSEQSGEWVIGNSTVTINGTQVGDIVAEDSLPIAVELDGNPSGTWNAGTQTWEVTTPPCAPATFSIDGTQVDTIASGADLDVSVELNGSPVTPTYNSGTKVIGVTGSSLSTLSVAVSDDTPNVGDSITITATATGFTPTDYYFFAKQGTALLNIGSSVSGVISWTVTIFGAIDIFAQAHDNSASAFNIGGELVTGVAAVVTANLQVYLDPHFSGISGSNYPDLSPFSRNGTLINSPTVDTNLNGGNILFNGVDQQVNIGAVADFSFVQNTLVFTIDAWFKVNALGVRNLFAGNSSGSSSQKGFAFGVENAGGYVNAMRIFISNGVPGVFHEAFTPNNTISSTGWHHVALIFNGIGVAQYYINGVAVPTTTIGAYTLASGDSSQILSIGRVNAASIYFAGRLGPFRVYNAPLSALQVQGNFNAERARYGL